MMKITKDDLAMFYFAVVVILVVSVFILGGTVAVMSFWKTLEGSSIDYDYALSGEVVCDYYIPNFGNAIYNGCSDGKEHMNPSDVIRFRSEKNG